MFKDKKKKKGIMVKTKIYWSQHRMFKDKKKKEILVKEKKYWSQFRIFKEKKEILEKTKKI